MLQSLVIGLLIGIVFFFFPIVIGMVLFFILILQVREKNKRKDEDDF